MKGLNMRDSVYVNMKEDTEVNTEQLQTVLFCLKLIFVA